MLGETLLTTEGSLWGLGQLCALHRLPYSADLLRSQTAPPFNLERLQRAAEQLGLRCGWRALAGHELAGRALPALALLRREPPIQAGPHRIAQTPTPAQRKSEDQNDPTHADAEQIEHDLALILRRTQEQVIYLRPGQSAPVSESLTTFDRRYGGQALLATPAAPRLQDPDAQDRGPTVDPANPTETSKAPGTHPASIKAFGFNWFIPELKKHNSIWREVLPASLAIQLLALGTPLLTQVVIDKVIPHQSVSTLTVVGGALAMFILFSAALSWVRQYLLLHMGNRIDAVLGVQVFEHLLRLPARYFEQRGTGVLVARVQGVETIREFLCSACVTLLLDLPFLFVFLAVMFWYSATLTLVCLAALGAIVIMSLLITPLLRARLNQQFLLGARNQAFLTEYISGLETVKSLQMEPQLNQRYGQYLASYLQAGFATRTLANSYQTVAQALEQTMSVAVLCQGAWLVMTGTDMSIGMLVAFQMFASRLAQPMLHLVSLWQQFQQADIAVKRLGDIMDAPSEPYTLVPMRQDRAEMDIELRDLAFRHSPSLPYLFQGLNLKVQAGQCLALMGKSGSGKSTLAKLMQGFYAPSAGSIRLGGIDIGQLAANELRSALGVVPQETMLFAGSVLENLNLANPHATLAQVMDACKMAEIHDTLEQLPKGYQTQIGEHGAGLSGGQKQRIAIARALLKKPKVLIFDEATSSLDEHNAEQFAATVNRLKGRVTMVFIAHRLPKGLLVDGVLRLGEVRGADEGTNDSADAGGGMVNVQQANEER